MSSAQLISYVFVDGVSYCFCMVYIVTIQKPIFFGKASKNWDLDTFVMRLVKNMRVPISEEDA